MKIIINNKKIEIRNKTLLEFILRSLVIGLVFTFLKDLI
jgi:hypothetical protein